VRAALLDAVGQPLCIRATDDPSPGPTELVLEVKACGICGSDLHISDTFVPPGRVLGHEFAGEIVAIGSAIGPGWRLGQLVAGFPVIGCGHCGACAGGAPSKCASTGLVGMDRPGAFAEYVCIDARQAEVLPEGLDASRAAMIEPLAVALHALECTPGRPGEPVLVLGGGPVGQAVALWALHLGAQAVVVSDPVSGRRAKAERIGAQSVDPTTADVRQTFFEATGTMPRLVVECVGVPGMLEAASALAEADGWVTVVGVCMQPDRLRPVVPLLKELTFRFVAYYRRHHFATTSALLGRGRLDPAPLLTGSVSLEELPDRFESLKHPTEDCKVLVAP
jgi:(R,R)-butanediol dehydrogenase/meso-butanediol dehydrogenase/diacetyl reductase